MQGQQKDKQILGSCQRAEKPVEHEGDIDTNYSWCTWDNFQRLRKKTGGTGYQKKDRDQPGFTDLAGAVEYTDCISAEE